MRLSLKNILIKKILETEKLIFDVSYEGKKYWENAKKHKFALNKP